jgi:hypothetical protein
MRVAINLTDRRSRPTVGRHWFWTRIIPEMANLPRRGRRASGCWSSPEVPSDSSGLRSEGRLHHLSRGSNENRECAR